MSYNRSLVVVCPAAVRDAIIALGRGVGVEAGMDVEWSLDGSAPATHYSSHSWVQDAFAALMLRQFYPGDTLNRADHAWLPDDWVDGTVLYAMPDGATRVQIDAILDQCDVSVDAVDADGRLLSPVEHTELVASRSGLRRVEIQI